MARHAGNVLSVGIMMAASAPMIFAPSRKFKGGNQKRATRIDVKRNRRRMAKRSRMINRRGF